MSKTKIWLTFPRTESQPNFCFRHISTLFYEIFFSFCGGVEETHSLYKLLHTPNPPKGSKAPRKTIIAERVCETMQKQLLVALRCVQKYIQKPHHLHDAVDNIRDNKLPPHFP